MDDKEKYFNSKEFRNTLRRYEEAKAAGREEYYETDELTDISEFYYKQGRLQDAVSTLDFAMRLHPGAAMPLVFRGRIALIDENNINAARHYVDLIDDQLDLDCIYLHGENETLPAPKAGIFSGLTTGIKQFLYHAADVF